MLVRNAVPLLVLGSFLLGGCHCTFKKYAPTIGSARVQVVTTGGPEVDLGSVYTNSDNLAVNLAAIAINVAQAVNEVNQTQRIAQAVQIQGVNNAMHQGFAQTLQGGPPFAYTTDNPAPAVVQIEVLRYGLYSPAIGVQGTFDYEFRTRIYLANGKRVYSYHSTCSSAAGDPTTLSAAMNLVNNVKQLNTMTDEQINDAFTATADFCGTYLVTKMRKHAG